MPSDEELHETVSILPGTVISGKYRVEHLIATGGMGMVVKAHHEVLDQVVAIKLMRPELAGHREAAQRFLREARAAAKISSDFVARVTDVDLLEDGMPFMVMEFLEGRDLSDVIESGEEIAVMEAVDYVMQALSGLQAAHALGVVHRDLKPSNLFLVDRPDGTKRVKILDFGISKVLDECTQQGLKAGAATSTQAVLGTPRYMSPEQISSAKNVDTRTDIWALALILYELLTRRFPFDGDNVGAILANVLTAPVPPIRPIRRDVSAELEAVIMRCLARNREDRYADVHAVMVALAPFASRRIQMLLLEPEDLIGPIATTESLGTPSGAMSPAQLEVFDNARAVSRRSDELDPTQLAEATSERSGGTLTSMSVEGGRGDGGRLLKVGAAVAVVAFVAAGAWWALQKAPASPTAAAPPVPSATASAAETSAASTATGAASETPAALVTATATESASAAVPTAKGGAARPWRTAPTKPKHPAAAKTTQPESGSESALDLDSRD